MEKGDEVLVEGKNKGWRGKSVFEIFLQGEWGKLIAITDGGKTPLAVRGVS